MPLPPPYQSFSEILGQGQAMGKSREADKLINLLTDQILNSGSVVTRLQRIIGLITFISSQRSTITLWGVSGRGHTDDTGIRLAIRNTTLNSHIITAGGTAFGQSGRFDRILKSVLIEVSLDIEGNSWKAWLNNVSRGLAVAGNYNVAPYVSDITVWTPAFNQPRVINTGTTLEYNVGEPAILYTSGVNFDNLDWQHDGNPLGILNDLMYIPNLQLADSGVYAAHYTNAFGNTISDTFTINVT